MDLSKIKGKLKTDTLGKNIVYIRQTSSTNAVAKELASKGAPEGFAVVADVQTEGRGRGANKWVSPEGGLWFSVILKPGFAPAQASALSLVAGMAVAKALRDLHFVNAQVKWPNDVLVQGRKVCGILSEASIQGEKVEYVVVGIGIDVNNPSSELKLVDPVCQPISIKEVIGKEVDIVGLLAYVLLELEKAYHRALRAGTAPIIEEWTALSDTIGKRVEVIGAGQKVVGTARRVTPEGALVVDNGKDEVVVTDGDCRYL
jgi:BirA family biotin operon repressor/biotin-[acetyl-CoA-carboxylase] ligase